MMPASTTFALILTVVLFVTVLADEECYNSNGVKKLVEGIRKNEIRMRKYRGTSVCFKDKMDDLPVKREYESDSSDVECYDFDDMVGLLGRCAKSTGDFDNDDFETSDRMLKIDTVVRRRCTKDDWCCLFPNQGAYTCSMGKCGRFVC